MQDFARGLLKISDPETGEKIAEHDILYDTKGKKVSLPRNAERYKETKYDDVKAKIVAFFRGNELIEPFLSKICEKYQRYTRNQYSIIIKSQSQYTQAELENALKYCVERELYSATYFRETHEFFRCEKPAARKVNQAVLPVKYAVIAA